MTCIAARGGKRPVTFLGRLRRNTRGNVLAMSAAAIIPLLAMIGGAIDASRMYMAYTRLQQACDSGALAGRKAMVNVTALTEAEKAKATEFFKFNFPDETYSAQNITSAYTKGGDGVVNGTASATMPTTIMKMFGYKEVPLNVTCQATLNIPNTDVMFVLDVTGSMLETPTDDTVSKIAGLQLAVKDFYAALGPGAVSGPGRIRYGFVPYSSNVNVGRLLYAANPSFVVGGQGNEKTYSYQSRVARTVDDHYLAANAYGNDSAHNNGAGTVAGNWTTYSNTGTAVQGFPASVTGLNSTQCSTKPAPPPVYPDNYGAPTNTNNDEQVQYPDNTQTRYWSSTATGSATQYRYAFRSSDSTCYLQRRTASSATSTRPSTTTRSVTWSIRQKFDHWDYQQRDDIDVSELVQGTGAAANPTYYAGYWTDTDPNQNPGYYVQNRRAYNYDSDTPSTITWGGCIEEADTVDDIQASSSLTPDDGAQDLKIDLVPSSVSTRWRPFLPQIQFWSGFTDYRKDAWLGRDRGWIDSGFAACPREANRLTMYASDYVAATKTSPSFNLYVDSLTAVGGTYHDIGLIWGARFLSPDGIFAADNRDAAAPGGYQVSRHIVFMTDGKLDTRSNGNDPWGVNILDGRIAPLTADDDRMNASHQRRTEIICNAMKAKGFTVWVIGFGISDLSQPLKDCASDDSHWSVSKNSTALRAKFSSIAQTIGGLRLSQ